MAIYINGTYVKWDILNTAGDINNLKLEFELTEYLEIDILNIDLTYYDVNLPLRYKMIYMTEELQEEREATLIIFKAVQPIYRENELITHEYTLFIESVGVQYE